ncbi:MAG TPA: DJ-1/PfpI family protein [Candidatus Pacearchaeota archaeon]|nr:DJ-1/PfpI family protein [Candidatus Pacearchaeota archaeon]HOC53716.1 DJ-1/PfpI family protein [Candidatus Pacearchaeota archaeon]
MKKIAFIISFKDFRDEEYFETKELLENNGFEVKTFSNEKGIAIGRFGGEAIIDGTIDKIDINEFNAIIFAGGSGAIDFLDNEASYRIIKEFSNKNKLIAAICIAPVILSRAGILKGKNATVWSSNMDKSAIKILKDNNAIFKNKFVVCDNNIITGNGPEAINEFSKAIIDKLNEMDIIKQ